MQFLSNLTTQEKIQFYLLEDTVITNKRTSVQNKYFNK